MNMSPFLKEIAEDLHSKFGTNLQHCAIIFNNKRPVTYFQKYLAEEFGKPFFSPSFFTIQQFFGDAIPETIADQHLQFFTLLKVYNELLMEEGLTPMKSSQFYPLAKIILSDFSQIDNDLVDADQLFKELENITVINKDFDFLSPEQYEFLSQFWKSYSEGKHKKQQEYFIQMWRRMPKLYHRFHEALAARKTTTNGGAYRKLASISTDELGLIKQYQKIIFIGFNALSRAEASLFKKLQDARKTLFYFDTDQYYFNDPLQEAGLFLRKNMHQLGLKNEMPLSNFMSSPKTLDIYKVQGQTAQAKLLNQIFEKDYKQQDAIGKTAIILADESLLIPALQTVPVDVNLNVTMGFPLASSSVFGLAHLWLECQINLLKETSLQNRYHKQPHLAYEQIESFLTHPLICLPPKQKEKIRTQILKENAVTVAHERLIKQGGIMAVFFTPATKPTELIARLSDVLFQVLSDLSNKKLLKQIDAHLLDNCITELNNLSDNIGEYLNNEEIRFIASLIQKVLAGISVPLEGDPLSGIQLMGLLETRNLNFDKVVFLGFNEGIVPKTSLGNSFIPDSLRRVYGLPVLENLDAISAYIVYRMLQRASNVSFVYNSLTDESASGEPSRFLKQLEYESNFFINYQELELPLKTQTKQSLQIKKTNPDVKAVLQDFLQKKRNISPSALTMYISNPIDFFFCYIAGIKEPDEVSSVVESNEVGSILHKAMELFYQGNTSTVTQDWIRMNRSDLDTIIRKAFFIERELKEVNTYEFTGMQLVVFSIVKAYMDIILDADEKYAPFKIIGLEQKIKTELPFVLNGVKHSINLKGIIDRIDEKNGLTRIVDYKTGGDQLKFTNDIEKLFDTDDKYINKALIQTMIYTYAYEQQFGKQQVQPVLYVVRTMSDDKIHFESKVPLEGEALKETKEVFISELEHKLAELFDESIDFRASELPDNYTYSIYKTIFE